jgi:CheY-like chemotaxis protein
MPSIFDAFEQGDRTVTRRHGGLGLGLAIAKTLVDLHGGTLTATSTGRDGGSAFRVEFDTIAMVKDDEPPDASVVGAGFPKVLLIDDNADTLRAVAGRLRTSGITVRTEETVGGAFAAMADERFDLLISDIGLPDGSGLDIMRHGRDHFGLKGIAFTGYGTDEDVRASNDAGFAHHLTKPANLNVLIGLIGRMDRSEP